MAKKTKKKYLPKKGTRLIGKKDAQIVGEHFEKLMARHGGITPDVVVDDARKKSSPTHKFFDWDDTAAAEKWRKEQARSLIRDIVEVVVIGRKPREHRSFHNVVDVSTGENKYVCLEEVMTNKDYRHQLIDEAEGYIEHLLDTLKLLKRKI